MDNIQGYELWDGGSIPSGRTNQWRVGTLGVDRFRSPAHLAVGDCSIQLSSSKILRKRGRVAYGVSLEN